MNSVTMTRSNKAARGTKRVCQACEVRFYDLLRDPIVCPSCGAQYTPVVAPPVDLGTRKTPAAKTGWRQGAKRPSAVEPAPDAESPAPIEAAGTEDIEVETDEVASTSSEDETVLMEPDGDDPDVTGLVGLDVEDPKEP